MKRNKFSVLIIAVTVVLVTISASVFLHLNHNDTVEESITVEKEGELYTVKVSDKGYNKKLPLMLSVSFKTDQQGKVIDESKVVDCNKTENLKYSNVRAYINSESENIVYLSVHAINVNKYNDQGVFKYCYDYNYEKKLRVDLDNLEVVYNEWL